MEVESGRRAWMVDKTLMEGMHCLTFGLRAEQGVLLGPCSEIGEGRVEAWMEEDLAVP